MSQRQLSRRARKVHRWLVPIAAVPLLITAGTGSLYSLLLGGLTVIVTISGAAMLLKPSR